MMEFVWPQLFYLAPLPILVYFLLPASRINQHAALKVPDLQDYQVYKKRILTGKSFIKLSFVFLVWLALLTAAARPQFIGEMVEIPQSGRDLMLAIDLSGSMQTRDFEINGEVRDRLTAVKLIAGDFIERRKGDRIGLILFGSNAYLQTPLTFDIATVNQLLMETAVGLAGNSTAMGDAIGLAIKQLRDNDVTSRVLILMTDGMNNSGEITPEKAAEIAAREQLKIYTIAIGAKEMNVQTIFGNRSVNPSSDIDEKTLKMISEKTGGQYFRAYNTHELAQIYQHIDKLESIEHKSQFYRPIDEMYYWPLAAALAGLGLLLCFESIMRLKR